jgi:hypothetical protein
LHNHYTSSSLRSHPSPSSANITRRNHHPINTSSPSHSNPCPPKSSVPELRAKCPRAGMPAAQHPCPIPRSAYTALNSPKGPLGTI